VVEHLDLLVSLLGILHVHHLFVSSLFVLVCQLLSVEFIVLRLSQGLLPHLFEELILFSLRDALEVHEMLQLQSFLLFVHRLDDLALVDSHFVLQLVSEVLIIFPPSSALLFKFSVVVKNGFIVFVLVLQHLLLLNLLLELLVGQKVPHQSGLLGLLLQFDDLYLLLSVGCSVNSVVHF
jgi:hypothetical protein